MDKETLERFIEIEKRVSRLESGGSVELPEQKTLGLDITLPKADVGDLDFNETEVSAVFDLKEDGWWHSRDILFLSARNAIFNNNRDILTEYLVKYVLGAIIVPFVVKIPPPKGPVYRLEDIEISLPEKNEGIKRYNGTIAPYWMRYKICDRHFLGIDFAGSSVQFRADELSGVAPMFRIKEAT
jgi:hypothetical protein